MLISKRDLAYLWEMHAAVREILEFMQGISQAEFEENDQLHYAVEQKLMNRGEATGYVSDEFQAEHPGFKSSIKAW